MRESLMYGSVRGARGNSRPYRDGLCARQCCTCSRRLVAHRVDSLRCEGSDAIGAKRTCRERRERVDLTKMTPTRHWGAAEKHRHSALPEREDRTLAACYRSFH
jgi:hypothetical protein